MGSQQAKYKQYHSRASRSEQWATIGKGEGTKTSLLTSELFFIRNTSVSFISKLHKRSSIAQNQSFQSSEISCFLVAKTGEVILFLKFL